MNHRIALTAVFCSLLIGCASNGDAPQEERRAPSENDYVTGTRIPQKNKGAVSTMTREEWERAAERSSMPVKEPRY
jgi:hypothetical protein